MENLFNVEIIYAKNFNLTYILATGKLFHFAHPLASYKIINYYKLIIKKQEKTKKTGLLSGV
jgi:hypothetical protein